MNTHEICCQAMHNNVVDMMIKARKEMTEADYYAFLHMLENTAWRWIRENYDEDYKVGYIGV